MKQKLKLSQKILGGAILEVGAHLVALNLYPLGLFQTQSKNRKHSARSINPNPVLLVHGIIHNHSAFISLKRKMQKQGWENIETLNYSTTHGNVFQMVEALSKKVDDMLLKTHASQIDIVAHSLGGIVARTYMSLGEGRGKIRKLITLGTPHQGTHLSVLARGLSRGALNSNLKVGSYLLNLLQQTALPRGSEIVSIYSPFDWTIVPGQNGAAVGYPENAVKNVQLDYVGHAGLLYSQEAFDAIVRAVVS